MPDYTQIESVLKAAVPHVAAQSGIPFERTIVVSEEAGGDVRVKPNQVIIHPRFATEGNPISTCLKILQTCAHFDHRFEEEQAKRRAEAFDSLYRVLSYLKRRYPDEDIPSIVEEFWSYDG